MTTNESKAPVTQRTKLHIETVEQPKAYGDKGRKLVNFQAKPEGAEKALRYTAFRDSLFELIKAGVTIEADVETKATPSDDPERPYVNRTIQQIYVDGKPVGGQQGQGGGRGGWGKSPEERASIERQVSLKLALDYTDGTNLSETLRLAETLAKWIKGELPTEVLDPRRYVLSHDTAKRLAKRAADELGVGITQASPPPGGGATIPPPVSAQAPTAAAGSSPAARQPGHAATPAASATAGAAHKGSGAPETSHGQPAEPGTPTFRNWGDVAGEIMKLPGNKGRPAAVARAVWDEVERRFEGVTINSWMDVGLTTKTPQEAFALAWGIAQEQEQAQKVKATK